MLALAFEMGVSEEEFWNSSPFLFSIQVHAYNKRKQEAYQAEWERTRWLGTILLQPYSKKRISPTDLILFPWERIENEDIFLEIPAEFKTLAAAMDAAAREEGLLTAEESEWH